MSGRTREASFRFLAAGPDETYGGRAHAGAVMKWIDDAAYACAAAWSGRHCVAARVGEMRFARPIFMGQVVDVRATLARTGRTSMKILVRVAAADPTTLDHRRATECTLVFVALDDSGRPTPVPSLAPDEDRGPAPWGPLIPTHPDFAWNSP